MLHNIIYKKQELTYPYYDPCSQIVRLQKAKGKGKSFSLNVVSSTILVDLRRFYCWRRNKFTI